MRRRWKARGCPRGDGSYHRPKHDTLLMNTQLFIVLVLLAICVALFIRDKPRMDVVALIAMLVLPLLGIVTVPEALAGFSDPNVILIGLLFIVGEGLVRTGIVNRLGDLLSHHAGGNEARLIVLLMLIVAVMGALMSSTGVVAIFIPVVLLVAQRQGLSPSRLMMPLSFAGLISGMLTLVGTPPNLVADSALEHAGHRGFGFFSFTPFGAAILVVGISYMLIARRWLEHRDEGEHASERRSSLMDFVRDYALAGHEQRLSVGDDSPFVGKELRELEAMRQRDAYIVAIERLQGSHHELIEPTAALQLQAQDILLVDFAEPLTDVHRSKLDEMKLHPLPLTGAYFTDQSRELGMAEVMLPPNSTLVGKSIVQAEFRSKHHLNVIGLRRGRQALEANISQEALRTGDVLLTIGRWKYIRRLQKQNSDFVVLNLPSEIDQAVPAAKRAPYATACLALMVALMITGVVPNVLAALLTCLLMGLTRCLTLDSAYNSVKRPSLILIVGMMPFSAALQKTGGVELAVNSLLSVFGPSEPRLLIGALFVITAVVGLFISNTATAVLVAPLALSAAQALKASPYPFVMTVALAASASFMTPVSSPVNTLVMVLGRYRFSDFVRVGVPFTIIVLLIVVILVPWLLPLSP